MKKTDRQEERTPSQGGVTLKLGKVEVENRPSVAATFNDLSNSPSSLQKTQEFTLQARIESQTREHSADTIKSTNDPSCRPQRRKTLVSKIQH